ncbi:MupA/Atu3671 family FMN-dependent luciferase-like monooxygenase [Streptomyces sp. NPDC049687]|uniref:MupA/Atu3671 family FMN-dependent luciferase-like monooxygenase n=1 Tax=Streptomyces sp. NPDC049687 TaxID=3365596 RepID=UPI00379A9F86
MADLRARLASLSPEQRARLRTRLGSPDPAVPEAPQTTDAPRRRAGGADATGGRRPVRPPAFSLFFFASDDSDAAGAYEFVLDCARFADRNGFRAVWVPERHFAPFGGPYPDPSVLAAAVAAHTEQLRVRAGSVVLPLHDPLLVAERWSMVDNLSRGRVDVSLASGWHAHDFALSPGTYQDRKAVLSERVAELRTLWAGGSVTRTDGNGKPVDLTVYPRPVQRELELWLTSSANPATWQAAAELGTHVLTALLEQNLEEVAAKAAVYRDARAARGLDPDGGEVTLMLHTFVGADEAAVRETVRPALQRYLRSHIDLFERLVRSQGVDIDLGTVTEADKQALVELAFERYFTVSGLFGTPASAVERVAEFAAAGVTEIGCLIDFGIGHEPVLDGLAHLAELKDLAAERVRTVS